jgi:hypothetical protein
MGQDLSLLLTGIALTKVSSRAFRLASQVQSAEKGKSMGQETDQSTCHRQFYDRTKIKVSASDVSVMIYAEIYSHQR